MKIKTIITYAQIVLLLLITAVESFAAPTIFTVPEPTSMLLLGSGLIGVGAILGRKRKK